MYGESRREIWIRLFSSALTGEVARDVCEVDKVAPRAARIADDALAQYDARYDASGRPRGRSTDGAHKLTAD